MPNRFPGDGSEARRNSVALFVDFENLLKSSHARFDQGVDTNVAGPRLIDLARGEGRVQVARAYADWTSFPDEARDMRRNQIEPILALAKESGDSRSGVEMGLDISGSLVDMPPVETYMIASGNSDLHPVLRRLREAGRRIVLLGIRDAVGRELVGASDRVLWLDDQMDFEGMEPDEFDLESYDWGPFVRLLESLEQNLEFIGLNYLIRRVLDRSNCGFSDLRRKQDVVNAAQEMGIIDVYQVENKDQMGDPVSACQLDYDHPIVAENIEGPAD